MTPPTKYRQATAIVRHQIADGILAPGAPAPSGAALARMTGYSVITCRKALSILLKDGTLVPGASRNARPRIPGANPDDPTLTEAKRALSKALAARRRAAGLTQPQLAKLIGLSVTTIGHAETGRTWQSRPFWELADKALNANGELLHLHNTYRAAEVPSEPAPGPENTTPVTEVTPPETDPTGSSAAITIEVPEPVRSITITWLNGTVTTVHPAETPTQSSDTSAGNCHEG